MIEVFAASVHGVWGSLTVRDVLGLANLVVTLVLGYFVARIRGLESRVEDAAKELVDTRINTVAETVKKLESQLASAVDRDHALEVKVLQELRIITEKVATKHDIRQLREELKR